jgi:hypothetical protein
MIQPPHLLLLMNLLKIIHKKFGGLLSKSQKIATLFWAIFGSNDNDGSEGLTPRFDSK